MDIIGHVTWRKASQSGSNGGGCVEVGAWRKATYSTSNGGGCIEVAPTSAPAIAVRDSKDPDGPKLAFTPERWHAFISRVKTGTPGAG